MRTVGLFLLVAAVSVSGCDVGTTAPSSGSGADGPIRNEQFCDLANLVKPLRQTVILVDAGTLTKTLDANEFAAKNAAVRDAILSIADPALARSSGASVPRERIVLAVAPTDGTVAKVAFSGCLPGYSDAEITQIRSKVSTGEQWFSSDAVAKLDDSIEEFRRSLIGGMIAAASMANGEAKRPQGDIANASVFASLRASKGLYEDVALAQRIVVISDLSRLEVTIPPEKSARETGMAAGTAAGGSLRGADVHVLQPTAKASGNQEWIEGYLLGQQGFLQSFSAVRFAGGTAAPSRRMRFVGRAEYPSGPQALTVVMGEGAGGKLASSFMILGSDPEYAIRATGTVACAASDECEIADDKGGFAQSWRTRAGAEPQFESTMPFAGMRRFKLRIVGDKLTGEVFDDAVIAQGTINNSIPIKAELK